MDPALRKQIGLLVENHVQYQFMNIEQIEHFYAQFYPGQWRKDAYYELMKKLKVAPGQRISRMSNGQRSQVALGLLLAQNPELLILDDFSVGLDPGYRRLFVDYLRDWAHSEGKTVFLTSHIIQDLERLVDDCIIMDYGSILMQCPLGHINEGFHRFRSQLPERLSDVPESLLGDKQFYHPAISLTGELELYSFLEKDEVERRLQSMQVPHGPLMMDNLDLEDAFIGLTGKY